MTIFSILRLSNSQVMKLDIFNLVLHRGEKTCFGPISGPDGALWMKVGQNDRGAQPFEHTKFDSDPCRYEMARAANVSNLPIAVESMPLEQSG